MFNIKETMDIKVTFVIPSNCESELQTNEEMQQAFEACKQNNVTCKWSLESICLDLKFTKTDFLVLQEFEGDVFEKVKEKSCIIIGPWCLLTCITEGRKIPNFPWPIYSMAMSNCLIAFSSFRKQMKKDLQTKIEYMGACVSADLTANCTHLITDSVKSEKYIKAAETGIKIKLNSWVDDVWEASKKTNIHCSNERFNKHKCPTFYKLKVCSTGLNIKQRHELQKLITENGGVYKDQMHVRETDILVCEIGSSSTKYKAAKKYKIKCVNMQWAIDSVKNGYAMPDNLYQIKISTSTPTKDGSPVLPNFSMLSHITNSSVLRPLNDFQDTIDVTEVTKLHNTCLVVDGPSLKRKSNSNEHNDLVNEINLKNVKMAGPFLDGCGVYLIGFGTEQKEKLFKILNLSGATRYDSISGRVTHVVVGDLTCQEFKLVTSKENIFSCAIVSIHWLLDSIAHKLPAEEEKYIISLTQNTDTETNSPLSKKSLNLLRSNTCTPNQEVHDPVSSASLTKPLSDADIVQQYLRDNASSQEDTFTKLISDNPQFNSYQNIVPELPQIENKNEHISTSESQNQTGHTRTESLSSAVDDDSSNRLIQTVFNGMKFIVANFTEIQQEQIKIAIEAMGGTVVPKLYKGIPDYTVVPVFSAGLKESIAEVVNDMWIIECWQENEVRPIEYFHRPLPIDEDTKPLEGCVITISGYVNYERSFLKTLVLRLGGIYQELLSRTASEKNKLLACTHLVSFEAEGKKYDAAIKWGLPVVSKHWLLECARISQYASETEFLVGAAKCSSKSKLSTSQKQSSCGTSIIKQLSFSQEKINSPWPNDNDFQLPSTSTNTELTRTLTLQPNNNQIENLDTENAPEQSFKKLLNSSGICDQITPVKKIIAEARRQNILETPQESLPFPLSWDHVDTPDTPLGAFIRPNPSPELRKKMVRFLNTLPESKPRRDSTPLSELKRQLWDQICPPKESSKMKPEKLNFEVDDDKEETKDQKDVENIQTPSKLNTQCSTDSGMSTHLRQLQKMLTTSGGRKSDPRGQCIMPVAISEEKCSQPNTVVWADFLENDNVKPYHKSAPIFMFSGMTYDERISMTKKLEDLGAIVLNSSNFDPTSTHLLCTKPTRNEKILAGMAAGIWILHPAYVDQCCAEKKFVDEETFEFGNPKSLNNVQDKEIENRLVAIHYWRKEIARRGYGAFHDIVAIINAQKREPLVRILQAGGGKVVNISPPFTKPVHVTHCLLDLKSLDNIADYIPLAKQGIYCLNTLYLNDLLLRTCKDVRDYIIPNFADYYKT